MKEHKIYRGIDLLNLIIEFEEMTPNSNSWTINDQKDNLPRLIRIKQINSLLSAFFSPIKPIGFIENAIQLFSDNRKETIQSILSGNFLTKQNITEFTELIKFISTVVSETNNSGSVDREIHIEELIMSYQRLIKFKKLLRQLLTFNSGIIECSITAVLFSIELTDSVSNSFNDKCTDLDKALELFINPKNLSFTENELIDNYNFPKDDLQEIDMEYW